MTASFMPDLDTLFSLAPGSVVATVTPLGSSPIETTMVWDPVSGSDPDVQVSDQQAMRRRKVRLRRDEVPALPNGSTIVAPEIAGGTERTYKVERVDAKDPRVLRATVLTHVVPGP